VYIALSICETTRVFSIIFSREFRHPQVMWQIILLSRVASHHLSTASTPLVGRLALLEGSSQFGLTCVVPGSCGGVVPEHLCCLPDRDTGGGAGPPAPIGAGGPLVGFIVCHPPPRGRMTEALWFGMLVVDSGLTQPGRIRIDAQRRKACLRGWPRNYF